MPTSFGAQVSARAGGRQTRAVIRPNEPLFHEGLGIYLKHVELYPVRTAVIEIHREPGAGWALAGGILFTVGNMAILALRRGR